MSEIRATTISNAAGTGPIALTGQSAAKAWANFNGTGTVAIRDSVNVSSLTDNGAGDYTINITSAFANTSVACPASTHATGVYWMVSPNTTALTTSTVAFRVARVTELMVDSALNHGAVFGDLA